MANFIFKRTEQKAMKIAGMIDTDAMIINVDGDDKKLNTLFSPFNGCNVDITIKVKSEDELDEPTDEE